MPRRTRIGFALVVAILLAAAAASLAFAQGELLGGKLRTGQTVTVGVDESVDGDLTTLGGQVTLNGAVTGDVLAAGGTLTVAGDVDGDLRTAGGQVTLNGAVGEDVIAAGGQTTLQGGATVEGDLVVSGGQVTMGGAVAGNIEANAGTYNRTGTVGGTENVVQGEDGAAEAEEEADDVADDVLGAVRHFVILLLLGAAFLWLLPRVLGSAETALRERPAASLGFGVLAFLGYFVLVVLAIILIVLLAILFGVLQLGALVAIEIVGGLLAIFVATFGFVLAIAFVADLVVGLGIGRLVARGPQAGWWQRFAWLAAGIAIVVIVTSLPIIGGIAKLLVVLFGLGALFLAARGAWRGRGSASAAAQAAAT